MQFQFLLTPKTPAPHEGPALPKVVSTVFVFDKIAKFGNFAK